jgi:hypothetical protein
MMFLFHISVFSFSSFCSNGISWTVFWPLKASVYQHMRSAFCYKCITPRQGAQPSQILSPHRKTRRETNWPFEGAPTSILTQVQVLQVSLLTHILSPDNEPVHSHETSQPNISRTTRHHTSTDSILPWIPFLCNRPEGLTVYDEKY